MKFYQKLLKLVLVLCVILLAYTVCKFKVDDMTLSKGAIYDFNENWVLIRQDGTREEIPSLPFSGKSERNELLVLENTLPEDYWGLTLSFLSADKKLRVRIDDVVVYEFGMQDERGFGHTPGSVVNFINIPTVLKEGKIRVEMASPYVNYGAKVSGMTIAKRDTLILKLLKDNMFNIACSLVILISGVIFALLVMIQKVSGQNVWGMQYLSLYCFVVCIYHLIETKTLNIFYGNQTLYSNLIFICLMLIPFLLVLYCEESLEESPKLPWKILLGIICVNIFVQLVLQLTNLVDFMDMAMFSHGILFLFMFVSVKALWDVFKVKGGRDTRLELVALVLMSVGGGIDIVRMYLVGMGDMGKYSRYGTTAFSIIMLLVHMQRVAKGYSHKVEENARLLQHEVEYVENKNRQLRQAKEEAEAAREEAETAKRAAIAASESKGRFLAHMSHEIRTPINAVLGMDAVILRESSDMKIKEYALDIQNAGQSLLALLNDILDFSKIESGKIQIVPVEYDFSSMIHDITNMISVKAAAKELALEVFVDETLPSRMYGDDVRLRQVLVNILNNAVKYTEAGSVTLTVGGEVQGEEVLLRCSVKDTGIGIKEEDISRLYIEFERIEEKRNRNIEGTGLGMNITTQLLELMGSRLMVKSVYGQGSEFGFELKQGIVDREPVGDLQERIRQQTRDYTYEASFMAPEAQILIVDDNAINRKVFVNLLKETGVQIEEAAGGMECLEKIAAKHYDLIFLDHMMPNMDGIETLHRMKEEPHCCMDTPVVALTANAISGAKEMYLSEGFHGFLSKPVSPEKLERMLSEMLPEEMVCYGNSGEAPNPTGEGKAKGSVLSEEHKGKDSAQSGEQEDVLPQIDGMDWDYALLHLKNAELLSETLKDFWKMIETEAAHLETCYQQLMESIRTGEAAAEDRQSSYRTQVHAMKSSAAMVGALPLSGVARMLEYAARDGKLEIVREVTPPFLEEWRSYKEKLRECVSTEEDAVREHQKEFDQTAVLELLEQLEEAMEALDIDEADPIVEQLEAYCYSGELQQKMEQLSLAVLNLDSVQTSELTEEIRTYLQTKESKA